MFAQLFMTVLDYIDVCLTYILNINKNVIKINKDKSIKLLGKNLINIILETGPSIKKTKKHHLILEVTILNLKSHFSFTFIHILL